MEADRELLEMAAKAAGYALCEWPDEPGKLRAEVQPNWRPVWNPLESDGDALRLAVKLRVHLRYSLVGTTPSVTAASIADEFTEPLGVEDFAATRRAIVRAAAAIGKEMRP